MNAANIAYALGDARREGRDWRCRCPLHNGRSLEAAHILASSKSEIYQRIARGELDAIKDGSRTKVTFASLKRCAESRPKARIRLYVPWPRARPP